MLATTQAPVNTEGGANSQLLESGSYSRYMQNEDVFLQLSTCSYAVICVLDVNKASLVQSEEATLLSWQFCGWYHLRLLNLLA